MGKKRPKAGAGKQDAFDALLSNAAHETNEAEQKRLSVQRILQDRDRAIIKWGNVWEIMYAREDWIDRMLKLGQALREFKLVERIEETAEPIPDFLASGISNPEKLAWGLILKAINEDRDALEKFRQSFPLKLDSESVANQKVEAILFHLKSIRRQLEPFALMLPPCPECGGLRTDFEFKKNQFCNACQVEANRPYTALRLASENAPTITNSFVPSDSFKMWFRQYQDYKRRLAEEADAFPAGIYRTKAFKTLADIHEALMAEPGAPAQYEIDKLEGAIGTVRATLGFDVAKQKSSTHNDRWWHWLHQIEDGNFPEPIPEQSNAKLHEEATWVQTLAKTLTEKWDAQHPKALPLTAPEPQSATLADKRPDSTTHAESNLQQRGLKPLDYKILEHLYDISPQRALNVDIEAAVDSTKATVGKSVDRLVQFGLANRPEARGGTMISPQGITFIDDYRSRGKKPDER